eukprot:TRINITY_DN20850_c0_g1_i1.p1 TRINITY_DN20850_c0_g1~~TRINITY_DN20850_c0_g1_i1.p1  ORF type:complete len:572 (-),score=77.83 TRINITY_DN20850_c0_g1_i1:67-1782(-)
MEAALNAFRQGSYVIVVCGEGDTCECSIAMPAEHATVERVAFIIRNSTGMVYAASDQERLESFGLHCVKTSDDATVTPARSSMRHYASTDFSVGTSTGSSAKDRAATLRALCNATHPPQAFRQPGHIFPLRVCSSGVLDQRQMPEAVYDLCRLAKLTLVGILAEIMHDDGSVCNSEVSARHFCEQHDIPLVTVDEIHQCRSALVTPVQGPALETQSKFWCDEIDGLSSIRCYSSSKKGVEIVALVKGDVNGLDSVPTRIHSECFTGDILGSKRCDCGQQLHKFMKVMNTETSGILLYIRGHEGRGIGLPNKIKAYHLQDQGFDTVDANLKLGLPVDDREYSDTGIVLKALGVKSIKLFTNNPLKIQALEPITKEVVAMASIPCEQNLEYLRTKKDRLNHRTVLETFKLPAPTIDVAKTRIGIIYTTWNQYYVDKLLKEAQETLNLVGVMHTTVAVPGVCELISGARMLLRKSQPDAILVIGVLIRGSSDVYDATCRALMTGLMELNASQDTPVIPGLLMCHDESQANERSHGGSNPAKAWAESAVHMAGLGHGESSWTEVSPQSTEPRPPA